MDGRPTGIISRFIKKGLYIEKSNILKFDLKQGNSAFDHIVDTSKFLLN
jgi:hypothetical protein